MSSDRTKLLKQIADRPDLESFEDPNSGYEINGIKHNGNRYSEAELLYDIALSLRLLIASVWEVDNI